MNQLDVKGRILKKQWYDIEYEMEDEVGPWVDRDNQKLIMEIVEKMIRHGFSVDESLEIIGDLDNVFETEYGE